MTNFADLIKLLDDLEIEDMNQRNAQESTENRWRSIPRDAAEFLSVLIRSLQAKTIVEIGTSAGYSTIWLGLVARSIGGKVVTYEVDPRKIELAKNHVNKASLADYVQIQNVNLLLDQSSLPDLIDVVFLDAEKKDYWDLFQATFPKLRPGGVIIADNLVSHAGDLREYIIKVRNHEGCNSVLISSVGNGLELTYKMLDGEANHIPWNEIIR